MKRVLAALALATVLTGCGAKWFPDSSDSQADNVVKQDVGGFISSLRAPGDSLFTTTTAKGVFSTYTSLKVPAATPVTLECIYDGQSGPMVDKLLSSDGYFLQVDQIVSLAQ
jgi:PBP1b-binding outer membrane lipoprotein LpoB